MKNYNLYVISACLLLLFSCAVDDEIITEDSATSNLELQAQEVNDTTQDVTKGPSIIDEELITNMHWISFVTAESFMKSISARQDFSYIASGKNYVTLGDLIGEDTNGAFKIEFYTNLTSIIEEAIHNANCDSDPMSCGAPEPPATTPPLPIGPTGAPIQMANRTSPEVQGIIDYLINYTLNEHCLELYVPKSLPTTDVEIEIAATQHPLTTVISNNAAIFTNETIDGSDEHRYIYYNIIYPSFIDGIASLSNNYAVIIRPKRTRACEYSDYSKIDFRAFFN